MAHKKGTKSVLVVGLGRFGSSVASTLNEMEQDVLAVDKDPEIVARWSSQIPVVQADMTDVMAIERIDASQFDTAVVAIGDSIEASVIAYSATHRRTSRDQRRKRRRQAHRASGVRQLP